MGRFSKSWKLQKVKLDANIMLMKACKIEQHLPRLAKVSKSI